MQDVQMPPDLQSMNCRTWKCWTWIRKKSWFSRIFTALHRMETRSSDENSVRLSVCLSVCLYVCQTRALWQNERKISL